MKVWLFALIFLAVSACSSGSEYDVRNKDIFDEAITARYPSFSLNANTISGQIQALRDSIMNRGDNVEATCAATLGCPTTEIEGIASTSSSYNFAITTNHQTVTDGTLGTGICYDATATSNNAGTQPWHCAANNYCSTFGSGSKGWATQGPQQIFARSFFLHDGNSGILVLYGLEPPSLSAALTSMKHISNARINGLVSAGDRIKLTVQSVRKYGVGANAIAVVTDFSGLTRVSSSNAITYVPATAAFAAADEYKVVRIEGTVSVQARFWDINCSKDGTTLEDYRFQFNHEDSYVGEITDAANNKYCFKLSYNVGAGTLSGFDTSDMFSYNFLPGAKVRLTGPLFFPKNRRAGVGIKADIDPEMTDPRIAASGICLAVDQKFQAETLR